MFEVHRLDEYFGFAVHFPALYSTISIGKLSFLPLLCKHPPRTDGQSMLLHRLTLLALLRLFIVRVQRWDDAVFVW